MRYAWHTFVKYIQYTFIVVIKLLSLQNYLTLNKIPIAARGFWVRQETTFAK